MRVVELSQIRIDGGTQPRESIDQKTVDEYAESYAALIKMEPVVVYFDGVSAWLADGFHRYHAAKKNGNQTIDVDWREGTLEKAKFYAAGANKAHGLRRRDADKKRAILMLLETSEGKRWASEKGKHGSGLTAIAKHCGVHVDYVSEVLATSGKLNVASRPAKREAVEKALATKPTASAREIAAAAGVSHTMVENVRKERVQRDEARTIKPDAATDDATKFPERGAYHERAMTRPMRQDRVVVPVGDDPALYAVAGYSRREARDIDDIVVGALFSAVAGMSDGDWHRLMRRIDMVTGERKTSSS